MNINARKAAPSSLVLFLPPEPASFYAKNEDVACFSLLVFTMYQGQSLLEKQVWCKE